MHLGKLIQQRPEWRRLFLISFFIFGGLSLVTDHVALSVPESGNLSEKKEATGLQAEATLSERLDAVSVKLAPLLVFLCLIRVTGVLLDSLCETDEKPKTDN